jgi:hypothetical protein
MSNTAWAVALMIVLAAIIATAFVTLWVLDKGRADEVADDPERTETDAHLGPDAREGAADNLPPELRTDRRH